MEIERLINAAPSALPTPPPDTDEFPLPQTDGHDMSPSKNRKLALQGRKPHLSDFDLVRIIGTGTFSTVWLVMPKDTRNMIEPPLYALKQLKKTDIVRLKQSEHIKNERRILQLCQSHPSIPTYLSSWQDSSFLYLLLEYSPGGELFSYLRRARRFDYQTTQFYAAEITLILVFLHNQGIVYRDLKPENILLDNRGHIKLVDFGFAKEIGDRETYTLCGTPEYLAPEVIQSKGHGKSVDWWALGVLIYEMCLGYPPFYDNSPIKIYQKILAGHIDYPAWVPIEIKDIVSRLCTSDLSARLGNMKRGGIDVLLHPFFRDVNWKELEMQASMGPIIPDIRFVGDTRNFDTYDAPLDVGDDEEFTAEFRRKYEQVFADFDF